MAIYLFQVPTMSWEKHKNTDYAIHNKNSRQFASVNVTEKWFLSFKFHASRPLRQNSVRKSLSTQLARFSQLTNNRTTLSKHTRQNLVRLNQLINKTEPIISFDT